MKTKTFSLFLGLATVLGATCRTGAQSSAFTFQGSLSDQGNPPTGQYDLRFTLCTDENGAVTPVSAPFLNPQEILAQQVKNGLFTVELDFGPDAFPGAARWLQIEIRKASNGSYILLLPRQQIHPTPYAIYAATAGALGDGVVDAAMLAPNAVISGSIANGAVLADKIATGQVVKSLNGLKDDVTLSAGPNISLAAQGNTLQISASGTSSTGWGLLGNSGTTAADFLGTTDNQPLQLKASGNRALLLEGTSRGTLGLGTAAVNVTGGSQSNVVAQGILGGTIAGGGLVSWTLSGRSAEANRVTDDFGTIGGGAGNQAGNNDSDVSSATFATVAGGWQNTANAGNGTVGGGQFNIAGGISSTVAGGEGNHAWGLYSVIGGGVNNLTSSRGSTVLGGEDNIATADWTCAAGRRAKAKHTGSFVWADCQDSDFASTANYQFLIRASGGVGIGTNSPHAMLDVAGDSWLDYPQLHLHETEDGDFARLRLSTAAHPAWDIAVGGGAANMMNFYNSSNGNVMTLYQSGRLAVKVLTITGGADLSEPFELDKESICEGSVVVIDDGNPGRLKLSTRPYDTRVAGIVSGAQGVHPAIEMKQEGLLANGRNIALTGRVYALADAANGPIVPGDLLTTSSTPGHAMKAADAGRAQGAILGKAMSRLPQGKGLVLVLVSLQ